MNIEILKDFTILCVDDEENILKTYKSLFELLFKKVYTASNGLEGLEVFKNNQIDIIISDISMPKMDGIEMVEKIREIDYNIPILLITAFENSEILKKAIELNVTGFIKKPIDTKLIFAKFELIAKSILAERYLLNKQKKFIEYTTYQEKLAYEKEKKISHSYQEKIKNYKISTFYKPKDILAGDSYVISNDTIFVVDAMGKGVSASITAMLSSAFIYYQLKKNPPLKELINSYLDFIKTYLLNYEVLSASFLKFEDKVYYAHFAMPGILKKTDTKVTKIKSNNTPISKSTKEFNIDSFDYDFKSLMIYTDGLIESQTKDGIYFAEIENDFLNTNSLEEFLKLCEKKCEINDDITIVYLKDEM